MEFGLIIIAATIVAIIGRKFKQPLIIAYILTGILLGPTVLNLVKPSDTLNILSEIGISLLLFLVGLSLNFNHVKKLGRISLIAGLGQVLFTAVIGYFFIKVLGFDNLTSVYISLALTFSSTVIVVKLLTDKDELDTLYGRITIGILLVQDFLALITLVFLAGANENSSASVLFLLMLKFLLLVFLIFLVSKTVLPKLFKNAAHSQELLLITSLSWCFLISVVSYLLGLSIEIGSFLAGISLAILPYSYDIINKIKHLRDFFIVIFFVSLGLQIELLSMKSLIVPAILLSLFVLVGNPIIVMIMMGIFGYRKKTGFMTGVAIAQISEFSLILVAIGLKLNHISKEIASLVTLIGIITITGSAYIIVYNDKIYKKLKRYLEVFERKETIEGKHNYQEFAHYDVVIIGGDRGAFNLIKYLKKEKKKFLIVDFNPRITEKLSKENIPYLYGDVSDYDVIEKIKLANPKIVISTVPSFEDDKFLIREMKGSKSLIFVISKEIEAAIELYRAGADFVIVPELFSGQKIADYLLHLSNKGIKKWGKIYYRNYINYRRKMLSK
ncbi:MAG: cation:proton antiporter [Nanoarchaeota archaeon]